MPLTFADRTAVLTGAVTVEDAETVAGWLRSTPDPQVDLAACDHLHTAVLQVLLAAQASVVADPSDTFLRDTVLPLLLQAVPSKTADETADEVADDTQPAADPEGEEVAPAETQEESS